MATTVTFLGACGVVTGSSTLLQWGDTRVLVDCGMYQGGDELEQKNREPFAFRPHQLDAVVLTHAHLDHSGLLPRLAKEGFDGPIYCTKPSRGLVSLLLEDAGEIQEEDARYARRKGYSQHQDPTPLYTVGDARKATRQLAPKPFDQQFEVAPGIRVRFRRAGHLLGAASVEVSAKGADGERRSWCFSGDVGRWDVPILRDPQPPIDPPAALLLESTYGDREHVAADAAEGLAQVIEETFSRGGVVIVPAFALGRTQEVLYYLSQLVEQGRLAPEVVYLDSPMAISATELYDRAEAEHDEELRELAASGADPLSSELFHRARSVGDSKQLNGRKDSVVIVAASGMATGGRVVHHLLHRLGSSRNSVVFVGYQAAGTRGRALVDGADTVGIHGNRVRVRAQIHQFHSLSAHADSAELVRWAKDLPARPERIFLNHGEDPPRKALAAALVEEGFPRPVLPGPGTRVPW